MVDPCDALEFTHYYVHPLVYSTRNNPRRSGTVECDLASVGSLLDASDVRYVRLSKWRNKEGGARLSAPGVSCTLSCIRNPLHVCLSFNGSAGLLARILGITRCTNQQGNQPRIPGQSILLPRPRFREAIPQDDVDRVACCGRCRANSGVSGLGRNAYPVAKWVVHGTLAVRRSALIIPCTVSLRLTRYTTAARTCG